jgi:hypothetical protein
MEELGSDPHEHVYQVIHTLRDDLLQKAAIDPSEFVLICQCLLTTSFEGTHSMVLTTLFFFPEY